jgi:hypothetical protein
MPRVDRRGACGARHKRYGDCHMVTETVGRCCVDAEQGWHQVGGSVDAVKACGRIGARSMGKPRLHCGMVEVAVHIGHQCIGIGQRSNEFRGDALFAGVSCLGVSCRLEPTVGMRPAAASGTLLKSPRSSRLARRQWGRCGRSTWAL